MPDDSQRNRREDFRIDDVIQMRDEPLSVSEFEARKKRIGVRSRMSSTLRDLLGRDADVDAVMHNTEIPGELVRAIESLDAKLNYLISMNMLNEADCGQLEEREVNISSTGISYLTDQSLEVGRLLQITLVIPSFPPQMVELLAEVKWVKSGESTKPQVGVGFLFRSIEEEESIARYVFGRHREMLRLEEQRT